MSLYQAPLKDMQLLIESALDQTGLSQQALTQEFDSDLVNAVLDEAGKFSNGELSPLNVVGDNYGCKWEDGKVTTPPGWKEAYQQFCEAGWLGLSMSAEYGGQSLPRFIAQPVHEMWLSSNIAFVLFQALAQGGSEIVEHFGTEAQKARYLEKMVTGQSTVTMALTEPNAGSDLGALTTKAIRQEDGRYLIKGQKIYITYGEHDLTDNIIHLILARTPDAPEGSRGISLFIVPKIQINEDGSLGEPNDVLCTGIEHKTGLHGSPTCSLSFGDNDACYGELLGEENKGLAAMFILMNEARLSTGAQGIGIGELGYQYALPHSLERIQGSDYRGGKQRVPLAHHPDVARMLLAVRSEVMGLRAVSYVIAAMFDKIDCTEDEEERRSLQARVALLTPIFKAHTTERGNLMAGTIIQIFGGMGFVEETGVAQLMRDARITTIYEGTTGIQARDLVFRKIQHDKGKALTALLDQIDSDAGRLSDQLPSLASALKRSTNMTREQAVAVVNASDTDLLKLHAGSVPMLEALGILLSGWQLFIAAGVALSKHEQDPEYYGNLVALADFYFAHSMPMIEARLITFTQAQAGIDQYRFTQ